MTSQISSHLQKAQQFTEETSLQISSCAKPIQQLLAVVDLAKKIIPLFEKNLTDENSSPNTLLERREYAPLTDNVFSAQQYAQKCVLAYPDLFPFFTQLFPNLGTSFEQIIEEELNGAHASPSSEDVVAAVSRLCYLTPKTPDAIEMLIDKIEKKCRDLGLFTMGMVYNNIVNKPSLLKQLTNYVLTNPHAPESLRSNILIYEMEKEWLDVPKICALLSRCTEDRKWGSLPEWFISEISSITDPVHQRGALKQFRAFINGSGRYMTIEQFPFCIKNPLIWMFRETLCDVTRVDVMRMIFLIAGNKASQKIAEELFQTLKENHPLNELILLPDDAKLFLLLLSLAPIQGISQEVCDALVKQVCPASQKGEHLEIYNNVLFHILETTELAPLDKEYLLLRILKEPAPVSCMRLIVGITNTGGFTFLQKNRLEKGCFRDILRETCRDILREACVTDNGPLSPIRKCSQKTQAHETEINPIAAEMLAEILHSDGFKKEEARDLNFELKEGQTIAEVQGTTALCEKTLRHALERPAVLSPSSLRALDTATSRTLRLKRFGHAYNLQGLVKLPNNTQVNLEGFNETFVIPMLRDMFDEFALNGPDLVTPTLSAFVKESLSKATWHDNASDEKIAEIHKLIHDPNYTYPVVVGSGWIWHSTLGIFHQNKMYYGNRGADSNGQPGISVYDIGNKEKITPEFLKRIASRLSVENSTYTSLTKMQAELDLSATLYLPMKKQKVGNCVYANAKAAIYTLLWIGLLKENAETGVREIYKAFSQFDKESVLEDFLIDLEEASTGNVGMEKNPSYLEGLATVTKLFRKWAIDHAGKNQKISSDLFVKAFTLICETG